MIRWNVEPAMKKAGVANAYQLAKKSGLTYQICWRIVESVPVKRIDVDTLEALAKALGVKDPLELLTAAK